jgi:hypothetical protein
LATREEEVKEEDEEEQIIIKDFSVYLERLYQQLSCASPLLLKA